MAQFVGIVAFCLAVWSFQQNEHKKIVMLQLLANACFAIHFYLIDAYTGALLNALGLVRSFVYYMSGKYKISPVPGIIVFSVVFIVAVMYTWEGYISLLPLAGMLVTTVAFGIRNPKLVRRIAFPSSPLWLIYNIVNFSAGGILTESFNMLSIIIGALRFDRKKKVNN